MPRRHPAPGQPARVLALIPTVIPTVILTVILAVILALADPATAQDTAIRLGQSLQLSGTELEVTADELEVDQASGATIFSGNVLVVQGDLRMTAGGLRLEYTATEDGRQRVDRLLASDGVTLVTADEAIEARNATYDLARSTLDMSGDVLFVQGPNILSGERFSADLATGSGRMSGRVRSVIRLD